MNYLERIAGKTIAVLGLGYVGARLFGLLKNYEKELDLQVFGVNRRNIEILESHAFDYVFNCAGNTGDFRQQPIKTVESNIQLNAHLLKSCKINESLLCLSSTRIYGFTEDAEQIFTESDSMAGNHLLPDALYDNAKKMMECLLLNTPQNYRKIIIRLSNVYGNYKPDDLDDSTFLKLMLRYKYQNEKLSVRQNPDSTKDYVFIDDALDGILRGGILSETDDVYNICSGESYSIRDWAEFLSLPIESNSDAPATYSRVSNAKAGEKIGFVSKHNLRNLGLADVIKYE